MKKLSFFLLLILVLKLTISVDCQKPSLLKFVLQWPPTFCIELNTDPQQPGRCQEPIPQHSFTLHGVWPADQNGYSLTCPPPAKDPDWNKVFTPAVTKQLEAFWPPLRENAQIRDLWKHEWRKHGACGGFAKDETASAQVYFNTAIKINNMIKQGNLFNYFKTNGIIACDSLSFTESEIVEAIQKVFVIPPPPLDVYLTCHPRNTTHVYLKEVTLCTDVDGSKFISCPSAAAPKSCSEPGNPQIMLPHPQPQPSLPSPPLPRRPPSMLQEWAKYIFNG